MTLLHREPRPRVGRVRLCPQRCHLGSRACRRVVRSRAELGRERMWPRGTEVVQGVLPQRPRALGPQSPLPL